MLSGQTLRKALHGGYYLHLEPGHCMVACGNYWLPTNILTSCRNEIMANADDWLKCVENKAFQKYFGSPQASSFKTPTDVSSWDQPQGFGLEKLKTCPSGFPTNYMLTEIWIRPTITYGLVACFVTESKNECD